MIKIEAERILKYKNLTIEIQRMWKGKTKVIQVIRGGTGTVSKTFRKYVSNLLPPWCRVLLEKLTGLQLDKKFSAFHGTRRFITAFTSARQLSLS